MFAETKFAVQKQQHQQQPQSKPALPQQKQHKPIWVFRPTPPFSQDFTLLESIGGGAYGKVYRCYANTNPENIYAVKIVSKNHFRSDLDLFRHEITIMQILHHPNLIQFINVYENESYLYIVMEYLPEGDLFSLLTRHFPTAVNQVENPIPLLPPPPTTQDNGQNSQLIPAQHQGQHGQTAPTSTLANNAKDGKDDPKESKSGCCGCCGGSDDEDSTKKAANRPAGGKALKKAQQGRNQGAVNSQPTMSLDTIHRMTQQAKKTYSERDVADWVYQIALGLEYLHAKNIVHADIKPENILVKLVQDSPDPTIDPITGLPYDESNSNLNPSSDAKQTKQTKQQRKQAKLIRKTRKRYICKIIDYGLSSLVERRHIIVSQDGSPEYMSPEVISGQYTIHSDMWSLGILLFNLLFGFTPFMAFNVVDTLKLIQTDGFRPDKPTLGHCNSFPEFFVHKTEEEMMKNYEADAAHRKQLKGAKNAKTDAPSNEKTTKQPQNTNTKKNYTDGGLDEPLLVKVSFDDEESGSSYQPPTLSPLPPSDDDSDDDETVFKTSVKPGVYQKSVQQIVREQYANLLPHVSSYAKDLIVRLLVTDPLQRLSAQEVLQHPWFVKCSKYKDRNIFQLREQDKPSLFGKLFGSKGSNLGNSSSGGFFRNIKNPFASLSSSQSTTTPDPNLYYSLNGSPADSMPNEDGVYDPNLSSATAHTHTSPFFASGGIPGLNPLQQYSTRTKLKRTLLRSLVEQLSEEDVRNWKKRLIFFNEQRLLENRQQAPHNLTAADMQTPFQQQHEQQHEQQQNQQPDQQLGSSNNSPRESADAAVLTGDADLQDESGEYRDGDNADAMSYSSYLTGGSTMTGATLSIAPSTNSIATTTPYWKVGSLDVIKLFNPEQAGPKNSLLQSQTQYSNGLTPIPSNPGPKPPQQLPTGIFSGANQFTATGAPSQPNSARIFSNNSKIVTTTSTSALAHVTSTPNAASSRAGGQNSPQTGPNNNSNSNSNNSNNISLDLNSPPSSPSPFSTASPAPDQHSPNSRPTGNTGDITPPSISLSKLSSRTRSGIQAFAAPRLQPAQSVTVLTNTAHNSNPPLSSQTPTLLPHQSDRGAMTSRDSNLPHGAHTNGAATDFITSNQSTEVSPMLPLGYGNGSGGQTPSPLSTGLYPSSQQLNDDPSTLLPPSHLSTLNNSAASFYPTPGPTSKSDDTITRLMVEFNLSNEELIDLIMASLEQKLLQKEDRLYALFDAIQSTGLTAVQTKEKNSTPLPCMGPQTGIGTISTSQLAQYLHISPLEANNMLKEGLFYLKAIHDDEMVQMQKEDGNATTGAKDENLDSSLGNSLSGLGGLDKSPSFFDTHDLNTDMINLHDDLNVFEDKIHKMDELHLNADQFIALFSLQEQFEYSGDVSADSHPYPAHNLQPGSLLPPFQEESTTLGNLSSPLHSNQSPTHSHHPLDQAQSLTPQALSARLGANTPPLHEKPHTAHCSPLQSPHSQLQSLHPNQIPQTQGNSPLTLTHTHTPSLTPTPSMTPLITSAVMLDMDANLLNSSPLLAPSSHHNTPSLGGPANLSDDASPQNIVNIGPFGDNLERNLYQYDDFNSEMDSADEKDDHLHPSPDTKGVVNASTNLPDLVDIVDIVDVDQFSEMNDNVDNYVDDVYEFYSNVMTADEYLALPVNPFQSKFSTTGSVQGGSTFKTTQPSNHSQNGSTDQQPSSYKHTPGSFDSRPSNNLLPPGLRHIPAQIAPQHQQPQHQQPPQPVTTQPQQSQLYKQSSRFGQQTAIVHNVHHKPFQQPGQPPQHQSHQHLFTKPIQPQQQLQQSQQQQPQQDQDIDLFVPVVNYTTTTPLHESQPMGIAQNSATNNSFTAAASTNNTMYPITPNNNYPSTGASSSYKNPSIFTNMNQNGQGASFQRGTFQGVGQQSSSYKQNNSGLGSGLGGSGLTSHYAGANSNVKMNPTPNKPSGQSNSKQPMGSSFTPTFSLGSFTNQYLAKSPGPTQRGGQSGHLPPQPTPASRTPQFEALSGANQGPNVQNSNPVSQQPASAETHHMSPLQGAMNAQFTDNNWNQQSVGSYGSNAYSATDSIPQLHHAATSLSYAPPSQQQRAQPSLLSIAQNRLEFQQQENILSPDVFKR